MIFLIIPEGRLIYSSSVLGLSRQGGAFKVARWRQGARAPQTKPQPRGWGGLVREGCTDLLAHLHEEAFSPGRARAGPPSALTPACYHSDPNFPLRGDINQSQERLFCVPSLCQGLGYGGMNMTNLLCTADSLWGEECSRSKRLNCGGRVPSEPTAGTAGEKVPSGQAVPRLRTSGRPALLPTW